METQEKLNKLIPTDLIAVEVLKTAELKKCSTCQEHKPFDSFGYRGKENQTNWF